MKQPFPGGELGAERTAAGGRQQRDALRGAADPRLWAAGGVYQGGALDQAPTVVGDCSAVEVLVVGAVEQSEETGMTAAQCQ